MSNFGSQTLVLLSHTDIIEAAAKVGFDLCGVAACCHFQAEEEFLRQWIGEGKSAGLAYMERNIDKRADVRKMVEGARSVIVCAVSYKNAYSMGYNETDVPKIASYALAADYHSTIKAMLSAVAKELSLSSPQLEWRAFTDSAPLFEKRYAVQAGLGWIGRQSLLVTPQFGTFVLLGELVVNEDVDSYDSPISGVGCGECRRCVEACPSGAVCSGHIDAGRCISRATVEKGDVEIPLHGWIFGCEQCQSCCPYNAKAPMHSNEAFDIKVDPKDYTRQHWQELTSDEYKSIFWETPLSRTSLERIKQNL